MQPDVKQLKRIARATARLVYKRMLPRVEKLMDAKPNTDEGRELVRLAKWIQEYEKTVFPDL